MTVSRSMEQCSMVEVSLAVWGPRIPLQYCLCVFVVFTCSDCSFQNVCCTQCTLHSLNPLHTSIDWHSYLKLRGQLQRATIENLWRKQSPKLLNRTLVKMYHTTALFTLFFFIPVKYSPVEAQEVFVTLCYPSALSLCEAVDTIGNLLKIFFSMKPYLVMSNGELLIV